MDSELTITALLGATTRRCAGQDTRGIVIMATTPVVAMLMTMVIAVAVITTVILLTMAFIVGVFTPASGSMHSRRLRCRFAATAGFPHVEYNK